MASVGYAPMFLFWAGCTLLYFLTVALFLPETKGMTLEAIEAHFARPNPRPGPPGSPC